MASIKFAGGKSNEIGDLYISRAEHAIYSLSADFSSQVPFWTYFTAENQWERFLSAVASILRNLGLCLMTETYFRSLFVSFFCSNALFILHPKFHARKSGVSAFLRVRNGFRKSFGSLCFLSFINLECKIPPQNPKWNKQTLNGFWHALRLHADNQSMENMNIFTNVWTQAYMFLSRQGSKRKKILVFKKFEPVSLTDCFLVINEQCLRRLSLHQVITRLWRPHHLNFFAIWDKVILKGMRTAGWISVCFFSFHCIFKREKSIHFC